jgi:hypothetical protein
MGALGQAQISEEFGIRATPIFQLARTLGR